MAKSDEKHLACGNGKCRPGFYQLRRVGDSHLLRTELPQRESRLHRADGYVHVYRRTVAASRIGRCSVAAKLDAHRDRTRHVANYERQWSIRLHRARLRYAL